MWCELPCPRTMTAARRAPSGRERGLIETLASGSLRVKVYAGIDPLSGKRYYLIETIAAGPRHWPKRRRYARASSSCRTVYAACGAGPGSRPGVHGNQRGAQRCREISRHIEGVVGGGGAVCSRQDRVAPGRGSRRRAPRITASPGGPGTGRPHQRSAQRGSVDGSEARDRDRVSRWPFPRRTGCMTRRMRSPRWWPRGGRRRCRRS
jgi:hypothetical protein